MKPIRFLLTTAALFLLGIAPAKANDIVVTYMGLSETAPADYIEVQFNVAWQHSWRDLENFDAAWIFIKYREQGGAGSFQHLELSATGHSSHADYEIVLGRVDESQPYNSHSNPYVGAFIQRSATNTGNGPVTFENVTLRAHDSQLGENVTPEDFIFQVHGIEMVYVTQGGFYLGSGGQETGSFTDGARTSGNTIPFRVRSEDAINIANAPGSLWGLSTSGNSTIGPAGELHADFPKGYNAFYSMKYQISQGQYAAFLNSLAPSKQSARYIGFHGQHRQGTRKDDTDEYISDNQYVAQNYLSWMDGAAYMDWAGLRPMTELEYEKASRGPLNPRSDEFAWGSRQAYAATTIINSGTANEVGSLIEGGGGDDSFYFFDEDSEIEYVVHAFTTVGEHTFVAPSGVTEIDVLIVGGGGGGSARHGGGGGAGGLVFLQDHPVDLFENFVYVGDGGIGGAQVVGECCNTSRSGSRGENSLFGSVIAYGGGGGMSYNAIRAGNHNNQEDGGSGGGGVSRGDGTQHYGPGTSLHSQGHNGGPGFSTGGGTFWNHGGGGGAGQVGGSGKANETGSGGDGLYFGNYFGESYGESGWFAGGGAGGSHDPTPTSFGVGGLGGGADSQTSGPPYHGLPGMTNTGGGGSSGIRDGGNFQVGPGGDGGSGIVLVRYPVPDQTITNVAFGNYPNVQGPLRVGAFAGSNTNRVEAGATYWGIMEMSGNLWERVVSLGSTEGRAFNGLHGNGLLNSSGQANVQHWPGNDGSGVSGASGSGLRGGSWSSSRSNLYVSSRSNATNASTSRNNNYGFRGVRTAPSNP